MTAVLLGLALLAAVIIRAVRRALLSLRPW